MLFPLFRLPRMTELVVPADRAWPAYHSNWRICAQRAALRLRCRSNRVECHRSSRHSLSPMAEITSIRESLKSLSARVEALRGYL